MDPTISIVTLALLLTALFVTTALALFLTRRTSGPSRAALQSRFGPEYTHAVEAHGSRKEAERDLRNRVRAVEALRIHPLSTEENAHYARVWEQLQQRFVDDPRGAVAEGHQVIKHVMQARGYPMKNFDERVELVSVDHGAVVQHYRAARALAEGNDRGDATTEDLRQAMVHYRALFADLLTDHPVPLGAAPHPRPA
jgi:hypothetical protein